MRARKALGYSILFVSGASAAVSATAIVYGVVRIFTDDAGVTGNAYVINGIFGALFSTVPYAIGTGLLGESSDRLGRNRTR